MYFEKGLQIAESGILTPRRCPRRGVSHADMQVFESDIFVEFHVGIDVKSQTNHGCGRWNLLAYYMGSCQDIVLQQLSPRQRQVTLDELPRRGVGGGCFVGGD